MPTEAMVNAHLLQNVIIDAGSMMNVMKYDTYKNLEVAGLKKSNLTLLIADGRSRNAIGYFDAEVNVAGVKQSIPIHVIDAKTSYELILGKPWLRRVKGFSDWAKDEHFIKDKNGKNYQLVFYDSSSSEESEYDTESSFESGTDSELDSKEVAVFCMVKKEVLSTENENEYNINPSLSEDKKDDMMQLLHEYHDIFASNLEELKQTDVVECALEMLPREKPVCCKNLRRYSPEERQACYDQLVSWRPQVLFNRIMGPLKQIPCSYAKKQIICAFV